MIEGTLTKADRKEVYRLLSDSDTHAIVVLTICLSQYSDYFEMDPLEIYARLSDDFSVTMPEALENRLQAITTAMTTNLFETEPSVYDSVVKAISDGDPDLEYGASDTTVDELMWAEYQIKLAKNEELQFSPAVEVVRKVLAQDEDNIEEVDDIAETLEEHRAKLLADLQAVGFEVERVPEF